MNKKPNIILLKDGRKLGYYEFGDPGGKPLINCHGGLVSGLDIGYADRAAQKAGVRIISPNRPGIGGSSLVKNRNLLDWPKDITDLANYLNIKKFAVLGWSMGGQYALACAYALPERVTSTIVVAGCLELNHREQFDQLNPMDKKFSQRAHKLKFIARTTYRAMWIAVRFLPKYWQKASVRNLCPADKNIIIGEPLSYFTKPMAEALMYPKGMIEEYNVFTQAWGFKLEDIKSPVQIWQGTADTLVPYNWAEEMHKILPNSKLYLLKDEGHFLAHSEINKILS
jgi:pimeloyl-ACP methyl ester carboxylesterase